MKKLARLILIIVITGFLLIACISPGNAEGYTVQPAYDIVTEPVEDTSREVSFLELTPRAMIICLALSISPLLIYPVETLLMLKVFVYLGYRKFDEILFFRNRNRQRIFQAISQSPGISFSDLRQESGMSHGVLQHHLHQLEIKKKIVRHTTAMSTGYFENNGWSGIEKSLAIDARNLTTRKILEAVLASVEISRNDIARIVNISGPAVTWHTRRLSRDEIITICRRGRDIRICLSQEAAEIVRKSRQNLHFPISGTCTRAHITE
jgi:predicted transcriptional regulator